MSSELRVNKLTSRSGVGTVTFNDSGLIITGIATAATLDITGSATAASLSITGNATIAGVLSYDDVTNVDSVGIITARSDLSIADKIIHTGDTNTAIRFPAADTVSVETAGSECLRIESSGRVKVKAGRLLVQDSSSGNSDTDGLALFSISNTGYLWNYENSPLLIATNGTERMRIDSSGRMGLGTNNPATPLVVSNSGAEGWELGYTSGTVELVGYNRSGSARSPMKIIGQTFLVQTGNPALNNGIYQDSSGQVYIGGTSGLLGKVSVLTTGTTDTSLHLATTGGSGDNGQATNSIRFTGGTNSRWANAKYEAFAHIFHGNGAEKMRIDSSGRLLLGTTTEGESTADNFTIADSGHCGITLRSGTSSVGTIFFSDGTSGAAEYQGYVQYDHSGNYLKWATAGAEKMRILSNGSVLMGSTASYDSGFVNLELRTDSTTIGGSMTLVNGQAAQAGASCEIDSWQNYRQSHKIVFGRENGNNWQSSAAGTASFMAFHTNSAGTLAERMRISSQGEICMGPGNDGISSSYTQSIKISSNSGGTIYKNYNTSNHNALAFLNTSSSAVGTIVTNNSSTTYNTSSDYRLKENVVDITGGIARVKQLAPKRFNFITDTDITVDGFLAHEAQAVVPEAVTGVKDGEEMQGIDHSKLVPLLTAALKEAIAEIESLRARVTTLEG